MVRIGVAGNPGLMRTSGHPDDFGPTVSGGRPGSGGVRWLKVGLVLSSAVMAWALVVGTLNVAVVWRGVVGVQRVPITPATDIPVATDAPADFVPVDVDPITERTTILLVGSDSREGLSDAQLTAIGTTDHGSDLTDTIMLLQLDPVADSARMLSFPRDLWVEHCNGQPGRINAAFATGEAELGAGMGPSCLVTTVETMTDVGIDHYVRLDFAGFVQAVDAIGGVTFHVDEPLQDTEAGLDLEPGCVDFDGVTAIQFVRARGLDSDLGRVARQQRFATELLDQVASVGTLANPVQLQRTVGAITGALQTDEDLGAGQLLDLASSLTDLTGEGLQTATVPVADDRIAGQDVLVAIPDQAEAAYAPYRAEAVPAEGAASGPAVGEAALPPTDTLHTVPETPDFVGATSSTQTC